MAHRTSNPIRQVHNTEKGAYVTGQSKLEVISETTSTVIEPRDDKNLPRMIYGTTRTRHIS